MKLKHDFVRRAIAKLLLSSLVSFPTLVRAQTYSIDSFTTAGGSGMVNGGAYSISGTVGQPDGNLELSGGNFSMSGGFWSINAADALGAIAFDKNLILNPSAEAGTGSISANDILPVPNWTTTNNFTVVVYDSSFPAPGLGFGTNFFAGGPTTRTDAINPFSTAWQMIDVSALTPQIEASAVTAELSGYFGGFGEQNDRASLTATYLDASANSLGIVSVGNVLAVDRTNHTVLLYRGSTNAVPAGTRRIQVVLSMTNESGFYYNDGYADNLSLVLRSGNNSSQTLFDNTAGSDNGGIAVTETSWLASKFCTGSQLYTLDSLSLLLDSQDFSGATGPPSSVRLQIYSSDTVHDKPSTSVGVVMNLFGLTNPISPPQGYGLVKWTPATSFLLSANTCYWAVLSREGGGNIGEIASFTSPTGALATLGACRSADGGTTWQAADPGYNFKMVISGTPISPGVPSPELAANGSTPIPAGTGSFTTLPFAPAFDGDHLAFYGGGSSGQQGIYSMTRGSQTITRIADLNTPLPNGLGNFLSLGTQSGIIIVGGNVLFAARGSGGQQGIYLADHSNPTLPFRIADTSTPIPGDIGNFTAFQDGLGFDGNNVAFVASGSGGQQGVYQVTVIAPRQVGTPLRIPDTSMLIPGGAGNFAAFPSAPNISGSEVAFIGNGLNAQQGIYKVTMLIPPQVGPAVKIADTATAIPGGTGNFTAFGADQSHPIDPVMSGDRLAFVGSGSDGQHGVYTVGVNAPPQAGLVRLADTLSAIPSGSGNFISFGPVSISDTDIAFLGNGSDGQQGIYASTAQRELFKVIDLHDAIAGKAIATLNLSRAGLFADPIAFQATFTDGSQGIYTMDIVAPPPALRITTAQRIGNDLQLVFPSQAGKIYAVQSSVVPTGSWTDIAGNVITGTGAPVQVTIPNTSAQPQQFYRIKQLP